MESRVGLDYIVEHAEYAGKLAAALTSPAAPVKKQVFELLSALCVYNADGYARAVDTLDRYKTIKGERYRLNVVVEELKNAATVDYKTALVAFINCIIISAPRLPDRIRVRNEFIGLGLLPTLNNLRHEAASHPDLGVQLDVFEEQRESDEAQGPGGINLNSHLDVFYAILKQVADTPQEIPFLSILQHLLRIDPKEPVSDIVWDTAETLVHRATLLESREDAAKLLRAPSVQHSLGIEPKEPVSDIVWDTAETLVHRATLLESREDAAKLLRAPSVQELVSDIVWDTAETLVHRATLLESREDAAKLLRAPSVQCPGEKGNPVILQHSLETDLKEPVSDIVWDTAETLVHRATLLESREDAAKLLRAPSVQSRKYMYKVIPPPPAPLPPGPPPPPAPPSPPSAPAPPPAHVTLPQQETPMPKTKMKTINWNKIPDSKVIGKNNIWSLVASSHKHSPKAELDWSEIEGLFCQQIQPTGSAGSSPRLGRSPVCDSSGERRPRKEASEITLLDGKRSLNVNIFLKQFRSSNEDIIQLIREGAHDDIGAEKLRGLLKILPEIDECEMLKAFTGDVTKLGNAEKFLLQLIQIPNYKLRIECMLLKEEWVSTAGYLESAINAILVAGDDLMNSRALQEVLYIALIAGNFLNAGGYAGGAAGVKLGSLQKLADIRANKPGMNLMHYVAMQAERKNKELIHFADDTRVLEEAAKASVEQLYNEIKTLSQRIGVLKKEIQMPLTQQDIREQMGDFLQVAEQEVSALNKDMEEVESIRKQLAEFFCEDPVSFKLEECFKIFVTFCNKFKSAVADNERRRANEEQAAQRRRARDAAAARTRATGGSVCTTPVSECESLMESLLLDIRNGLGRRSLRRPHDPSPSPDVTPTGSLRRRSRASPGADEDGLLEFLRHSSPADARERSAWGSLDRSWSRRGAPRARLEIPERERAPSPRAPEPASDAPDPAPAKPKEWRQKIESWLRANSQEERREAELRERARRLQAHRRSLENDSGNNTTLYQQERREAELRERARRLQAHRRSLENDSESERSATLDPLPEARGDWRPAVLPDSDVVRALETVEDVQPQNKDRVPWRKTEENEEMRRLRRQRSRPQLDTQSSLVSITEEEKRRLPDIQVTSEKESRLERTDREIDADNIETPPVQRKMFNPPPEREPCRKFQPSLSKFSMNDKATAEMKDLCQEILGDGQFDRFSAARRTRRYKRNTDSSSPEDEKKPEVPVTELVAETQVIRPSKLEVQASYAVETPQEVAKPIEAVVKDEKEHRLKRWQDRLKNQSTSTPTKETKPTYSRMRRQTSINQEDVQKAIRELKSPTETPTGVWSRNAYRKSTNSKTEKPTVERTTSPRMSKVKSEHELNDEGFEETQSLNSESASQGASSGCNVDCDSPVPKPTKTPEIPKRIPTKDTKTLPRTPLDPKRAVPKRTSSLRVERSTSRASLRSSRSSLNSSASVATVKRAPAPVKPTPKPVPKPVSRMPASRSSSSGSSVGASRPPLKTVPRTSGFMRPTQASKGRGGLSPQQIIRASVK
ncbi:FH2 domain-containing protein 1 [Ostrinia nubilalis]|uniref:FH2 domain-containing protein 1 n=1 Tax=Ostrinia nubilalis TaxID=29057 RepID=UPI003082413C